jgi:cytochrome c oxidase assembly protein subunit 15
VTFRYNSALHRFSIVVAASVFLLIVAGALVTSNNAGLAVPDWPTSFGSLYKIPPMVGGVKYEHGHRMLAELIGLLTLIFAIWTQLRDPRRWMKQLAWFAVALVIIQGVFGGVTVRYRLPWYTSTIHGILAQTFFALTVLFAVFNGRRWMETEPAVITQKNSFDLRQLSWLAVGVIYMQLFFGAAFRHSATWKFSAASAWVFPFHFHVYGAVLATIVLFWVCMRALIAYPGIKPVRGMAIAILALLITQLALGLTSYFMRELGGRDAIAPSMGMIHVTVAHVAVGALLLAHCFMLAVQANRHLAPAGPQPVLDKKVVTA